MRRFALLTLGLTLLGLAPFAAAPALAQADGDAKHVTLYATYVDPASVLGLSAEPGGGLAFASNVTPYIALEGSFQRVGGLEYDLLENAKSTALREFRFGALFFFNRPHDRVLPFVSLGIEYLDLTRPAALDDDLLEERNVPAPPEASARGLAAATSSLRYTEEAAQYSSSPGVHWGVGTHVFLSERLSLRFDLRWVTAIDSTSFNNFEPYLGLSFWTAAP